MNPFYPVIYALFGAVTGSFLNVCILRIPKGETFITGRSHCPFCSRQLPAHDMVPILSWLLLRGKCRYCHARISLQYPAVEAGTALIFSLCCLAKGPGATAVIMCSFASLLTVAAWIDARYMYIPDSIHVFILLLALISMTLYLQPGFTGRIAGALGCGIFLELLSILTRGGVGRGDVKLLAASGFLLGLKVAMVSIFMAYVMAGLWYLIPLLRGRVNGKTCAPMAPFFGLALMVCALWYGDIMTWYMGLSLS